MDATDITTTITTPADQFGSDWNWAEEAADAWLTAARAEGITIEDEDYETGNAEFVAGRVRVDGTWFDLEVGRGGDPNEVRAVEHEYHDDDNTYDAHINRMGEPEITIMTNGPGIDECLARYPLSEPETDAPTVLRAHGWSPLEDEAADRKYSIITVEPVEIEKIIKHVTFARAQAEAEYQRQDFAWRTLIRDAMKTNASATRLAMAAQISRERVYQIRDGRR